MDFHLIDSGPGKKHWSRYLWSFLLILFFYMVIGSILYMAAIFFGLGFLGVPEDFDTVSQTHPLLDFYMFHISNLFWIIGMLLAARLILKRKLRSFVTPYNKIRWERIWFGFWVFFALVTVSFLVNFLIFPSDYKVNDINFKSYMWLCIGTLFLVPIQTTSEELFFRGFLVQWIGRLIKQPVIISLIIAAIFGSLHFANPEMGYGKWWVGLDYVFTGFMLTYIALNTNSAELSIGAHAANNMFISFFITTENSAYGQIPSLFVNTKINAGLSTLSSILIMSIFYYLAVKKFNSPKKDI